MDLVILAGGAGTRLAPPHPKPLVRLLGLTLLERVAWQAWKAYTPKRILIVGGYQFHRLQKELSSLRLPPASIHLIHNPHWEKGNGTSVLAVQPWMKDEPFLVTMVDHLLPASVYQQLATLPIEEQTMVVAVDPYPPEYIDLDDASKVQMTPVPHHTHDTKTPLLPRVRQIGKTLPQWDAIDVGVFRLHPSLFPYLKQELETQGTCTLLGALQHYIREGGILHAWSIHDNPTVTVRPAQFPKTVHWVDIDTPEMLRIAERILLHSLAKPTDGPIARWINRPLSRWMTRHLVALPITPNHITVFAFLLAVGAALLMAIPQWLTLAIGGTLAQVASIIDGCDGEIARLKFLESERGAWLDAVLDRYADAFLISAFAFHLMALTNGAVPMEVLIWLVLALTGTLINSYTADKYDAYLKRILSQNPSRLPLRIGRDVRIFLVWIGALANLPLLTLAVLGILNHGEVLRRIGVLFFRQKA